jgi:hypothetical protein
MADDRLSQLSDAVLGHILSFLPAFDAARAAVLSRRWRDTFAAVHTVSLNVRERPVPADDDFVGLYLLAAPPLSSLVTAALLARHRRGGGAPLRELRVAFRGLRGVNHSVVEQWLSCAVGLALPGGELHLDLRVLGDVACSLGHEPLDELDATCRGEVVDLGGDDHGRIPAPTRLFSCAALRSLRLGPARLDHLPPQDAIHLPSLETLLLTRVAGAVQRLVSACPRLADLTLEACADVTAIRVQQRLRRLALRCCHDLAVIAVDGATELRAFEYRGGAPGPSFLTCFDGPAPMLLASCTLDFTGGEPPELSELLAGATTHLHLKSARLGVLVSSSAFPESRRLRHLELTGISANKDATIIVDAVAKILHRTPNLETMSLFFLPEPLENIALHGQDDHDEAILGLHQLRYDRRAGIAVPPDEVVPSCLRERVREINLVHHQGGVSQRMLAKFLLRHALVLERLCCAVARGPLWMQCRLVDEIRSWTTNKSARMLFV